jgi:methyl-accepting chemotaxis protein
MKMDTVSKWFHGLRLKFLFILGLGSVAIISLFLVASFTFRQLEKTINQSTLQDTPSALSLSALNSGIMTMTVRLHEASTADNAASAAESLAEAKEERTNIETELKEFKQYDMSAEEEKHFNVITSSWVQMQPEITALLSSLEKNDKESAAKLLKGNFVKILDTMDPAFTALDDLQTHSAATSQSESASLIQKSNATLSIIALTCLIGLIALGLFTVSSVIRTLSSIISKLEDSSVSVNNSAGQISYSAEELSQASTEQASSLEETSAAVEEMNSMVQKNAESAQLSLKTSQTSSESAGRGKKVVDEMKRAMVEIDSANARIMAQTNESNTRFAEIVTVIGEIGNKTKVINDIVFQTKLLSFNASVEAARAGEHGKGFAVVAEEVGNLAQMSGNAAKEITSMLDASIKRVEDIVRESKTALEKLIVETKTKVEVGARVAVDCGDVLEEIVQNVTVVAQMSHSISTANDEQARGLSEITKAVTQLDQMTQQNAASSEEAADAAQQLTAQAKIMESVVHLLSATMNGEGHVKGSNRSVDLQPNVKPQRSTNKANLSSNQVLVMSNGKSKHKKPLVQKHANVKLAAGSDIVPSEDDSRFKDI